ncbi:CPBP family intramembrane glutamic endopeptidase [Pedobacter sp. Hv1]|uniref:CPBP family intramembrane glutamic endopeptidase n=1 Tax=Pedobacter sp. Hv1 TaxID=1740090 RepID=UPI0006D89E52|nr:type II CAAX endopeptidase family protein [Pedobacter sp. Hv1]KQC00657.1 hypothetical protein AQF98_08215 [Pedobacter sp. Hv1]
MGEKIFYYLHPVFRLILFVVFIFLCILPFGLIAQLNFFSLPKDFVGTDMIYEVGMVLAVLGALLMTFKTFPTLDFRSVFLAKENMASGFLKGSLIGILLIGLCGVALWLSGNVVFAVGKISLILFFAYLLYFVIVGLFEELMFRTLPLFVFAERYPIILAIVLNGLLFGAVHMANPGFTWLAMLNITLAGILFAVYTLQKRNLSWAVGIHFGWNFAQGILLGYKVSGTDTPGVLVAKPIGNTYLSGGVFGIEGSVVCTAVLAILIVYLMVRYPIAPVEEAVFETELKEETDI